MSTMLELIAQLRDAHLELCETKKEGAQLRAALEKIAFDSHAPSRDPQGNSVEWYAEQAEIWAQKALDEWAMGGGGKRGGVR